MNKYIIILAVLLHSSSACWWLFRPSPSPTSEPSSTQAPTTESSSSSLGLGEPGSTPTSSVTLGCGPEERAVVSGDVYNSQFAVKNVFTHTKGESSQTGYWLAPDNKPGSFIINLGCQHSFSAIKLVNTHNWNYKDRSTKKFRLSVSLAESGPWVIVLETTLEDSRQQSDPLPLQVLNLKKDVRAQFLRFDLLEWYGLGGGLQFLDIEREGGTLPEVFKRAEQFAITKSNKMGVLPFIGRSFFISFELFINSLDTGIAWRNILHFSIGRDNSVYGDRTPGLWIHYGAKFYVCSAMNGNKDNCQLLDFALDTSKWYNIEISQQLDAASGKHIFSFKVDGNPLRILTNNQPRNFKNVNMYIGDPWYSALDASVKELTVKTADD